VGDVALRRQPRSGGIDVLGRVEKRGDDTALCAWKRRPPLKVYWCPALGKFGEAGSAEPKNKNSRNRLVVITRGLGEGGGIYLLFLKKALFFSVL
jgi:hypothetical protein